MAVIVAILMVEIEASSIFVSLKVDWRRMVDEEETRSGERIEKRERERERERERGYGRSGGEGGGSMEKRGNREKQDEKEEGAPTAVLGFRDRRVGEERLIGGRDEFEREKGGERKN